MKKIVWQVTDCYLPWLADKTEWKDTTVVWEITPKAKDTQITFTHVGLVPAIAVIPIVSKGGISMLREVYSSYS